MERLKKNALLQRILIFIMLDLYILFFAFVTQDYAMVYGTAIKNADMVEKDKDILGIVSWDEQEKGKFKLMDTSGNEHEVGNLEFSLIYNDKNIAYYSKEQNMLLQPIGEDYVYTFLKGHGVAFVMMCMCIYILTLFFACLHGGFIVMSEKRYLILSMLVFVVSLGVIGLYFVMLQ